MKQSEAVRQAVINVCGQVEGAYNPTDAQRENIHAILFEGFKSGTIELKSPKPDAELKRYCSSLTNNWLRKDPRLNGGNKYETKNPGSRAGVGDEGIKAMRALKQKYAGDPEKQAQIQQHIDKRLAELKQPKAVELTEAQREALRAAGLAHLIAE